MSRDRTINANTLQDMNRNMTTHFTLPCIVRSKFQAHHASQSRTYVEQKRKQKLVMNGGISPLTKLLTASHAKKKRATPWTNVVTVINSNATVCLLLFFSFCFGEKIMNLHMGCWLLSIANKYSGCSLIWLVKAFGIWTESNFTWGRGRSQEILVAEQIKKLFLRS
jgi:hypothetical protein